MKCAAGPKVRLLIALIALVVGLLGFMQYTWFSGSASTELEVEYRALASEAGRAASREYQRYAPLLGNLRSLSDEKGMSLNEAEHSLANAYRIYGPSGSVQRLLSSVGVLASSSAAFLRVLGPSGSWSSVPSPLKGLATEDLELEKGELGFRRGEKGAASFIIARYGDEGFAVIELDEGAFFDSYIKGAVASALRKASIEWSAVTEPRGIGPRGPGPRAPAPGSDPGMGRSHAFNPLTALFDPRAENGRSFDIIVPATIAAPPMPGPEALSFRGVLRLRPVRDAEGERSRRASLFMRGRVLMPADSSIGAIERRLSLYWLFDSLLLLGIGAALALALVQVQRLRALRAREREFVASITQELHAPVAAIGSASDNVRRGLVGADRMASYGEMIHAQALRLAAMIDDVLMFAQGEVSAPPPPKLEPVFARALEEELKAPFEAIAKAEGISLSWDFAALQADFLCDAESLGLAFSNLVTNALYHAYADGEGGEVRVYGAISPQGAVRFIVEDDGRGIEKKEKELVFEPFYRSLASRERRERGSGLGLFIARRKARYLGGDIRLESPYDRPDGTRRQGCRFTLELPVRIGRERSERRRP